jgi:hypothetical protein
MTHQPGGRQKYRPAQSPHEYASAAHNKGWRVETRDGAFLRGMGAAFCGAEFEGP